MNGWVIIILIILVVVIFAAYKYITENNIINVNDAGNSSGSNAASPSIRQSESEITSPDGVIYFASLDYGLSDREYRFDFRLVNNSWRAYILKMPSLRGRDASGYVTHRLFDNGKPYICWNTSISSLKDMQNVARVWADSIQEYIATGKRFGPQ